MSTLPAVTLGPSIPLSDSFFPLAHPVALLQKYNNSGLQLPITLDEYQKENGIIPTVVSEFTTQIDDILTAYRSIKANTNGFKANILPNIVSVASDIVNFSKDGTVYYDAIFNAIAAISQESGSQNPDRAKIEKSKATVDAIIPDLQKSLYLATLKAGSINPHLTQLKLAIQKDLSDLKAALDKLHHDLNLGEIEGDVGDLQKKIEELRKRIALATKSYEDTIGKINDIPKWGWIPFIGWITAGILHEKWVQEAIALSNTLTEDKSKLDQAAALLASRKTLAIRGSLELDLQRLIDQIDPVISTLLSIQGAFGSQSSQLYVVGQKVAADITKDVVIDTSSAELKKEWSDLAARADAYRLYAYVSTFDPLEGPQTQQA